MLPGKVSTQNRLQNDRSGIIENIMSKSTTTVRIKVSPQVVRIVGKKAPRELQLSAARGALPLDANDLLTVFFFLCNSKDRELKTLALSSLLELPVSLIIPVVSDSAASPQLLYFIIRERIKDQKIIETVLQNPSATNDSFLYCAKKCSGSILMMIAENSERIASAPELVAAIIANPLADKALKFRLGWTEPEQEKIEEVVTSEVNAEEDAFEGEIEEEKLSKYQQILVLGVAEKIKIALTGDKEWRTLLLRESNKLVSSAVLKNPRITENEVLAVAKSKASNDEMIRLILLNREWLKSYEMKKTILRHPRTPLNKALRFMSILTSKDLKMVAKSKDVSAVLVNNARRILMIKEKKGI
jgi:hypothetical protein